MELKENAFYDFVCLLRKPWAAAWTRQLGDFAHANPARPSCCGAHDAAIFQVFDFIEFITHPQRGPAGPNAFWLVAPHGCLPANRKPLRATTNHMTRNACMALTARMAL
jgi:hypothetical protein